jgi:hypothetical protein
VAVAALVALKAKLVVKYYLAFNAKLVFKAKLACNSSNRFIFTHDVVPFYQRPLSVLSSAFIHCTTLKVTAVTTYILLLTIKCVMSSITNGIELPVKKMKNE